MNCPIATIKNAIRKVNVATQLPPRPRVIASLLAAGPARLDPLFPGCP